MAVLYTNHFVQFFDSNGDPLSGGKLYAYSAGTTTPKATYTTEQGNIQNSNPIVLDSAGRATVFIDGSYRFDLYDSNDALIKSTDNVTSFKTLNETGDPFFQSFSGTGSQTVFTLSESLGDDSKDVMVFVDNGRPNYVVNGDFATDTNWTKGSGWTIAVGVATATGAISTAISQTADSTLVENQSYVVTYTITRSAGGLIPSIGGRNGVERTASGTYSEVITAGSTQTIAFTGNGFTGTLDTVVVKTTANTGYEIQSPSAYTLSGTSLTFNAAPESGTDNIYVFSPTKLLGAAADSAAAAAVSEANAASSASDASDSADAAALSAAAAEAALSDIGSVIKGTSTTSLTIGTGSKSFTTQSNKGWALGQRLRAASDDGTKIMDGEVTAYSGTSLTLSIDYTEGSGTHADWNISIVGPEGPEGPEVSDGDKGDVVVSGSGTVWTLDISGVSAGSYTNSNITVDAKGRVTSASSGSSGLTIGTPQASTSGTSLTFSIPANTKAVYVGLIGVSTNGTSNLRITLNSETTGYVGDSSVGSGTVAWSTGILATQQVAATGTYQGVVSLRLMDSSTNTWCASGVVGDTIGGGGLTHMSGGYKSLSAALSSLQLTTVNGTDTFDAGTVNIQYE